MERLTKAYDDGTHVAADNLPCGENSWNYKELLLNKLGAYEDTGLEPGEVQYLKDKSEPRMVVGHRHINHIIPLVMRQSASVRYAIRMWLRMMIISVQLAARH